MTIQCALWEVFFYRVWLSQFKPTLFWLLNCVSFLLGGNRSRLLVNRVKLFESWVSAVCRSFDISFLLWSKEIGCYYFARLYLLAHIANWACTMVGLQGECIIKVKVRRPIKFPIITGVRNCRQEVRYYHKKSVSFVTFPH